MEELFGKYSKDCKIFAETIEAEARSQVYSMLESPAFKDIKVRMMPDMHAGKNCCIGTSYPIGDFVDPCHVGVDIGCRMTTIELSKSVNIDDYALFEHRIREAIPTGFDIHKNTVFSEKDFYKFLNKEYNKARSSWPDMIEDVGRIDEKYITALCKRVNMDLGTFYKSIASLGGGNHYMEYGETDDGRAFFTVHCGSRNFGVKVCNYWAKVAKRTPRTSSLYNVDEEIKKIKATVEDRTQWRSLIDAAKEKAKTCNPQGYLSGDKLKGYLNDMLFCQLYAEWNHICIHNIIKDICLKYHCKCIDEIYTKHNYISFDESIHYIRKGAIQSYKGQKMIIPFNMRDGLAICEGKSNDDWNYSAPHGAGRLMSRSAAKKNVDLDEFKKSMEGIYSTCVGMATIDESPMAYKDMNEIVKLIEPTAEILFFVKPKINIKATDGGE